MTSNYFHRIATILLILISQIASGQEKYALPSKDDLAEVHIYNGIIEGQFAISKFFYTEKSLGDKSFLEIYFKNSFPSGVEGSPLLPAFSELVQMNRFAAYALEIIHMDSTIVSLRELGSELEIIPVKPPALKNSHNRFNMIENTAPVLSHQHLIELRLQGTMRSVDIGNLRVHPFKYNTDKRELTVYHSIHFRMVPDKQNIQPEAQIIPDPFKRLMKSVVRSPEFSYRKKLLQEQPLAMVILSDTIFRTTLEPLVAWKNEKGFQVIEAYTDDPAVGKTSSEIREYMKDLYQQPPNGMAPPSYLLIVGDVEHVPVSQSSGQITDLYYTTFDGEDDYLPEMFHGRISVKDTAELRHIIDKILMYEKYEFPDPAFLDKSILIAGYDSYYASTHGNGQINYASNYYFNQQHGIDAHVYLHPEASQQDGIIIRDISEGAALVNYTGHGEYYGWLDPVYKLQHIDTMKNFFKYPLMIGNGCSTNSFNMSSMDCFAEAVLKLEKRGAIGYIGCTNDSYWDEDYYWAVGVGPIISTPDREETTFGYYDKVFHQNGEPVEQWAPSMGEMIYAGNMTVQQSTSTKKKYYWEIYQLMGDPTLVPWFKQPGYAEVEYPAYIPPDARMLAVRANPYDYVALSHNGELIDAMHTDEFGQLYFEIPEELDGDTFKLVVTGDNRQPFIDSVRRIQDIDNFLELTKYQIINESISSDGIISPGERFSLDLNLVNLGVSDLSEAQLILRSENDFINITDSVFISGTIPVGDTGVVENAFRIEVTDSIKDKTSFALSIQNAESPVDNYFFIRGKVSAPDLVSGGLTWDERAYGNGNGIIEKGETLLLKWNVDNRGSYSSDSLQMISTKSYNGLKVLESGKAGPVAVGGNGTIEIKVSVTENSDSLQFFTNSFKLKSGKYKIEDSIRYVTDRFFEDFSTGNLSRFRWYSEDNNWVSDSSVYFSGPFSFRSGKISHESSSSLSITLGNSKPDTIAFHYKVSSEPAYDFFYFYIDGELIERWSGSVGWSQFVYVLEPGIHQLKWEYSKDINTSGGFDAAWIDQVIFPQNAFSSNDLGILEMLGPKNNWDMGADEAVSLRVRNNSIIDTIFDFNAAFKLDQNDWVNEQFTETILPGGEIDVTFQTGADFTELKGYFLVAKLDNLTDLYPGNDSLAETINHFLFPDLSIREIGIDSVQSVYANAIARLKNEGNSIFDSVFYVVYIDNQVFKYDTIGAALSPGDSIDVSIGLLTENDGLESGWYDYSIALANDSVDLNNRINGSIHWLVQSLNNFIDAGFNLYPNPANEKIYIELENTATLPVKLEVISLEGKMLYTTSINQQKVILNLRELNLKQGLCIIRLSGKDGFSGSGLIKISGQNR